MDCAFPVADDRQRMNGNHAMTPTSAITRKYESHAFNKATNDALYFENSILMTLDNGRMLNFRTN